MQVYVLPHTNGWAIVAYGDANIPDDQIIPLPLTSAVSFEEAMAFVATTDIGKSASIIDGWPTMADLVRCEPELATR